VSQGARVLSGFVKEWSGLFHSLVLQILKLFLPTANFSATLYYEFCRVDDRAFIKQGSLWSNDNCLSLTFILPLSLSVIVFCLSRAFSLRLNIFVLLS
jgi:hypothetical protein